MRKIKVLAVLVILLATMAVGCVTLQDQWNQRTPDEQARIIANGLQDQLNDAFDIGKVFVTANPKYKEKWLREIVPAFKIANDTLAEVISLAQIGKITPDQVYPRVMPFITKVTNYLISIGAIKAKQAMVDVTMLLTLISGLLGLAFKFYQYAKQIAGDQPIETWEQITDKNRLLAMKIDAELEGTQPPIPEELPDV